MEVSDKIYIEYKLKLPEKYPGFCLMGLEMRRLMTDIGVKEKLLLKRVPTVTEEVLEFVTTQNRICCGNRKVTGRERTVTGEDQLYKSMLEFLKNTFADNDVKKIETFCNKHSIMKQKVRKYAELRLNSPERYPEFRSSLSPQMIAFLKKIDVKFLTN